MGIIIDISVIAFILLCVLYGYKKGLVKVGIRLVSFLIAIIITFILYRPIANAIINYTTIDENIQNTIVSRLNKEDNTADKMAGNSIIENTKDSIVGQTANTLSYNIIYAGVMILLFLISRIILVFISALADLITNLPIIKQCDKIGGILYGIIIGFAIVLVILLIISFIVNSNTDSAIGKAIDETFITKLMYENNILNIFFNK